MGITAPSPLSYRHPTSCCSVAEIMSVLYFHTMKYRPEDPRNFNSDRFVLSKVRVSQSSWSEQVSKCLSDKNNVDLWLFFSSPGSRCSGPVLHVGGNGLPEGERAAQFVPGWLSPGGPPNPCKLSHTVPHLRNHLVEHKQYRLFLITFHYVCVVCISEAANCGRSHWLPGAGSWCGLWNGLHWEVLWQVQVIFHTCGHIDKWKKWL